MLKYEIYHKLDRLIQSIQSLHKFPEYEFKTN